MRRAVITGLGAVSCIGNDKNEILDSLKQGRSGIVANETFREMGLRSQVSGSCNIDFKDHIDRKALRFMGGAAAFAYIAMQQAIDDAGLEDGDVSNVRMGLIAGSGGASSANIVAAADTLRSRGVRKIGPYMVTKTMGSTVAACLATPFRIKGINYSITSACATSAHCIGAAAEQIAMGKQDIVFAGGGEEEDWTLASLFDAMGALSTQYNDEPARASRAYDAGRDGFVIASGSGMVVVEELEHAKARGAKIYAELVGFGATSDGYDMVAPSGEGGERSMRLALSTLPEGRRIDYINSHGTSTPVGDVTEMEAVRRVFGKGSTPPVASTKSLTGHSLGATGVHEAIYSLIMMNNDFIAASANVTTLDPALDPSEIVTTLREGVKLDGVLSNSFGFGGTNATLVMSKYLG